MTPNVTVTFLGTGSALPGPGNSNSCYFVRLGSENLLIDAGPAILQQLDSAGISPREISHIFFTHRHGDHALGYPMLMLWYWLNPTASIQTPVIIASQTTLDALDDYIAVSYGLELTAFTDSAPKMALPVDAPGVARIHPGIMLKTLPMTHSDFAPVLGLRIETRGERLGERVLAFTGDTAPNDNIARLAQNADLLVHEANFSARLDPQFAEGAHGHSTAQHAGRHAAAAGAKRLALTHISNAYADQLEVLRDEAQAECSAEVCVPLPGVTLSL
jgi:ribonuclease Z